MYVCFSLTLASLVIIGQGRERPVPPRNIGVEYKHMRPALEAVEKKDPFAGCAFLARKHVELGP